MNQNAVIILLLSFFFLACEKKQNTNLQKKKIKLQYVAWACECPNWVTLKDIAEIEDENSLAKKSIFIEAETEDKELPETLGCNGDIIEFTGNFYPDLGYPKNYIKTKQKVDKARVFKYSEYKVIKSNYKTTHNSG
ncbi:hypothetical protein SAMN05444377_11754 [Flavobacterium fontis]|uniref:Uncharacterized protein n=1 Tax=Flavobacterium fontis TaxID=1124188 RepID=A0A1M5E3U4_9FLAO|nr:hypothetical protein [Flavobacterium fontis]SHF73893.1 hypothetical protein SAMN05444377_11754 [Flavobacterium fontis]